MEMPKPSDADKEHFRKVVPDHPDVVVKPMFGNLGAFVNGNMFAGLFGPTIGVKLSEADKQELEGSERTVPFGPPERPMGGYTGLPEVWNAEGDGDDRPGTGLGREGVRVRRRPAAERAEGFETEGREEVARGRRRAFSRGCNGQVLLCRQQQFHGRPCRCIWR